jgi:hypothetical protein
VALSESTGSLHVRKQALGGDERIRHLRFPRLTSITARGVCRRVGCGSPNRRDHVHKPAGLADGRTRQLLPGGQRREAHGVTSICRADRTTQLAVPKGVLTSEDGWGAAPVRLVRDRRLSRYLERGSVLARRRRYAPARPTKLRMQPSTQFMQPSTQSSCTPRSGTRRPRGASAHGHARGCPAFR